jgi:hypothetical protein
VKSGDPMILLAIVIVGAVAIAFPLAILINRIGRWWRFESLIKHIERPMSNCEPFSLSNREILPPHKSAARPSNVMALTKPVHKSAPKTAA